MAGFSIGAVTGIVTVGLALLLLGPLALGVFLIVLAVRSARRRQLGRAIMAALCGLLGVYISAAEWGTWRLLQERVQCQTRLGRQVYVEAMMYASNQGGKFPGHWAGDGPEPLCEGSGAARTYEYRGGLELRDPAAAACVIACCPCCHRRCWWVPFDPLRVTGGGRVVLFGNGRVEFVREREFREHYAPAP